MHRPLRSVTAFLIVGPHTLRVTFDDGITQEINFRPILAGEVLSPLQDVDYFNQVRLDPEDENLVWPNGANFDPAELHDWPEVEADWIAWAQRVSGQERQ